MDLFFNTLNRMLDNVEARMPGPAWQDKTADEYYKPESEVTDDRLEAQDSLFGIEQ